MMNLQCTKLQWLFEGTNIINATNIPFQTEIKNLINLFGTVISSAPLPPPPLMDVELI